MRTDPFTPRRILAVINESHGQLALRSAIEVASNHGADLDVLACVEPPRDIGLIARLSGSDADTIVKKLVAQTRATITERLQKVCPDRAITPYVAAGKPFLEVIRHVAEAGCDLVIKAAEPLTSVNRFLFASTDQHLLRKCPCPVWLQTPTAPVSPKRIIAAIDLDLWDAAEPETLTDLNRQVVNVARALANVPDAQVIVLHAWDAIGEGLVWAFTTGKNARLSADRYVNEVLDARLKAMNAFMASINGPDSNAKHLVVPKLVRGAPEEVIEAQSRMLNADLVVMGTVARTGISGIFIGNTAENIINSLGCPILAVKPEGFVSPVLRS
ncbi:universal stress protein [Cognatiyoonia sp. IB215182]|uniref:universal stress protein n=1 Tax=Cognatiyoonia sp. IB215182 TaxID=3097353 RepID=UPI002A0DF8C6|nr:universal stress protein [Cognatiyoonia sp. IB215182]MDX8355714.1 universal stress protein [Cognatiyoonia sp. IB215182]